MKRTDWLLKRKQKKEKRFLFQRRGCRPEERDEEGRVAGVLRRLQARQRLQLCHPHPVGQQQGLRGGQLGHHHQDSILRYWAGTFLQISLYFPYLESHWLCQLIEFANHGVGVFLWRENFSCMVLKLPTDCHLSLSVNILLHYLGSHLITHPILDLIFDS